MKGKFVLVLLFAILFINIAAVLFQESKSTEFNTGTLVNEINLTEQVDTEEKETGSIGESGAFIQRAEAAVDNSTALEKSRANQLRINQNQKWTATDYDLGDIQTNPYEVQLGDTLWEIAEAYYGNGQLWTQILELNSSSIGYIDNMQVKIIPGQILVLE